METEGNKPSMWILTAGVLAMMIAVGVGGYVFYRYMDDLDVDELIFDTWVNEKRELFTKLAENINTPVDIVGTPQRNDWITRSGGGTLKWSTTLYEVAGEPLSSPAVVDFNNDGRREIVVASAGDAIYCLEPMSGGYYWQDPWTDDIIDYLGQTPQTSGLDFKPPPIFASVIVADVTAGDTPEVIIGVKDGALCLGSDGQKLWKKGLT
ncbi:MAG: VCBS repeat-containing protein, partial [Candidatus Thermoplasmatota archaeon]|nr:VCBS repeat-containing protein [Candidatus Thermoplasmatota archaeon]